MMKWKIKFIVIISLGVSLQTISQNIDSLLGVFTNKNLADTVRLKAVHKVAYAYMYDKPDTALLLYQQELELAQKTSQKLYIGKSLNNMGLIYENIGQISKALEYYHKSLRVKESNNDKEGVAGCFVNIAYLHLTQRDIDKSIEYNKKALKIREEINNQEGIASTLNNLGLNYKDKGDTAEAMACFIRSMKIREALGNNKKLASSFSNIASVYLKQMNYIKALEFYNKALEWEKKMEDKRGITLSLNNIGYIYNKMGDPSKALNYLLEAYRISNEIRNPRQIQLSAGNLVDAYKALKKHKDALYYYEIHTKIKDSLINGELANESTRMIMKYEFDKKQTTDSLKIAEERKINDLKFKQEQTQRYYLYVGLILLIIFSIVIFNRFRSSQKQKLIIESQKILVEEKHKEITDSINYAERIQRSLLASQQMLDENLGDYFVFFKPKDVVSGDFYWASSLKNNQFALITADSTGHGVPGAIMSILNIACLNEAVKEGHTLPNEILNRTRKEVINVLKRDGSAEGGKDGMDCSLLVFNKENNLLQIAAANNPVWIVRASTSLSPHNEVIEIKPDKMPVGKHEKQEIPFTLHEIQLQKDDVIYTLTDGFPDQFGGERGKKFMSKNLRELLATNTHLPMHEQKQLLETTFTNWKKDVEQVDDVTVIGVRI